MQKTDVLVIGGSAGGILAATTAKKIYADKNVVLVRKSKTVMVPCGIPYIFGTLMDAGKNRIPDAILENAKVELVMDEVTKIDKFVKTVTLMQGEEIAYEKLIIATGSRPIIPKFIEGYQLKNVYPVLKEEPYLKDMLDNLKDKKKVIVIGGGFIGLEFAEQLKKDGKEVYVIEAAHKCLWQAFDDEECDIAEQELTGNGIQLRTGVKVKCIRGREAVEAVELETGEVIQADAVILGIGVVPNADLATAAGILTNQKGAIIVDEYMRTSEKDVFAVGDCAEKRCFFTNKEIPILLASTAAMEAKIAASNLYGLKYIRENKGTVSAFSTKIFHKAFASAGITRRRAEEEGFDIVIGKAVTMDKHPGSLPDTGKISLSLIFVKTSGVLIGAQISGGDGIGEMINILSLAIQKGLTANELNTYQVATHPLLTASPIAYPINSAALDALVKLAR